MSARRHSRRFRALAAALAAAVVLTTTSNCGAECCPPVIPFPALSPCLDRATGALAMAIGARANRPRPALPQEVQVLLGKAGVTGQTVTVVSVDGRPSKVGEAQFRTTAQNDLKWNADYRAFLTHLTTVVTSVRAKEPEADPLAALQLMSRSSERGGTVILIDSGIQTVEPLNFLRADLWTADPQQVANGLAETNQLPDLRDRVVVLASIGDTAAPQAAPGISAYTNLLNIWRAIAERAGAACVEMITHPQSGDALTDVPPVTVVPVPQPVQIPLICPSEPADQCSVEQSDPLPPNQRGAWR